MKLVKNSEKNLYVTIIMWILMADHFVKKVFLKPNYAKMPKGVFDPPLIFWSSLLFLTKWILTKWVIPIQTSPKENC